MNTKEGLLRIDKVEATLQLDQGQVWYETVGLPSITAPLLMVHGGPGYTRYLDPLAEMHSQYNRPVILYDQLGCGYSDKPGDTSLWTIERSIEELHAVIREMRQKFGIREFHLLGHSYGAGVVAKYLIDKKPQGIISAVLASPLLNSEMFARDTDALKKLVKDDDDTDFSFETLFEYGKVSNHPAIIEAEKTFNHHIYETMWGPNEHELRGNLIGFNLLDGLEKITCPVLFTCGANDEVRPSTLEVFRAKTPASRIIVFKNSAHFAHLEEPELYMAELANFLNIAEQNKG